jgi:hypothetical protein
VRHEAPLTIVSASFAAVPPAWMPAFAGMTMMAASRQFTRTLWRGSGI